MGKANSEPRHGRRDFLKGAVALGGAATVVSVASGAIGDAERSSLPAAAQPEKPQGYRVTEHVRTYYEKAGF